jgi:hypothetical protein
MNWFNRLKRLRGSAQFRGDCGGARHDETGAVLVLALLFLFVVGGVVGSIAGWATNDLNNTAQFANARTTQYAVTSTVENAIENIRYTPLFASQLQTTASSPGYCWGGGPTSSLQVDGVTVTVWCYTNYNPQSSNTRQVTFSACTTANESASACALNPTLQAMVTFDDYPIGFSTPSAAECAVYCGTSMTENSWTWAGVATATTTTTVPPTTTTTVPPTTTTTTTVPPTTTTTTTVPQSNGVTAAATQVISGSVAVNNGGTDTITLNNPSAITALTITINVAQTSTAAYQTEWNNFWQQWGSESYTTSGGYITYTYVLAAGQSMNAGFNGNFNAQYSDGGQSHNPTGDTWSVTSTSGGATSTLTGAF